MTKKIYYKVPGTHIMGVLAQLDQLGIAYVTEAANQPIPMPGDFSAIVFSDLMGDEAETIATLFGHKGFPYPENAQTLGKKQGSCHYC